MATTIRKRALSSLDELLTYAVGRIESAGEECTLERLVFECYSLFPDRFSMQGYPEWPDAIRIDKSWRRCRTDRGWIVGNVQQGFRLSEHGRRIAHKVGQALDNGAPVIATQGNRPRGKYDAMLRHVRQQPAFARYVEDADSFTLEQSEMLMLLNATLETPSRVLHQNLRTYLDAANEHGSDDLAAFLKECGAFLLTVDDAAGRPRR